MRIVIGIFLILATLFFIGQGVLNSLQAIDLSNLELLLDYQYILANYKTIFTLGLVYSGISLLVALIAFFSGVVTYFKRPQLISSLVFLLVASLFAIWLTYGGGSLAQMLPALSFYSGLGLLFLVLLYLRIGGSSALIRQRARILLFGIFPMLLLGFIIYYMKIGWSFTFIPAAILPFFFAYAILRYNPYEVDNFIRKLISIAIILGAVIGSYYLIVFLSEQQGMEIYRHPVFSILFILFFLFSYDAVDTAIEKFVTRYLFGLKIDFQKVITKISDNIATLLDISKIIVTVKAELMASLRLKNIEFLIAYYGEEGLRNEEGSLKLSTQEELYKLILKRKGTPISIYELMEDPVYSKVNKPCLQKMKELKAVFIVPLAVKEKITGLMLLGERKREALYYSLDELACLQNVAFQTAIAVENTQLYKNLDGAMKVIQELHDNLEKKVEERTDQVKIKTEELNKLNALLKDTTERKTEFLANMSHELRTPLNAVMGFAELVQSGVYGEISDQVKQAVGEMKKSGNHLLGLINDVLDLSKVEAGQIELKLAEFTVKDVIEMVQFSTKSLLDGKGLYLKPKLDRNLPVVWGDQKRISQVFINLIGNSAKFTEKGGITLRVKKQDASLRFEVEDTGAGIPPDKIGDVFKEFKQVHVGEKGGTGLGLAICKKLIELHGGKIWVESKVGKGTKFIFLIPSKPEEPAKK